MKHALARTGAALYGAAWELRRSLYARGWRRPESVPARVVSVGNLTVGGTGKTTLVLHLARAARASGVSCAVVCRRYRPGPDGEGDEERLYRAELPGSAVLAGASKLALARAAAAAGHTLAIVDDGFSHWPLARDLDLVLVDAQDPLGGAALLPAGRLREPLRALQRADAVVVTRLAPGEDPAPHFERVKRYAPAAALAAGRHEVTGVTSLDGAPVPCATAWIATATGHPGAVERSARESGLTVAGMTTFRDHHWFTPAEARGLLEEAGRRNATLLLTAKDAVRWPPGVPGERVAVLRVRWAWVAGGEAIEAHALRGEER
jgi:tetraacyldisaccharide 4'-kinase